MNALYTYGNEFEYADGSEYVGWYYQNGDGYWTGMYKNELGHMLVKKSDKNSIKSITIAGGIITPTSENERFISIKIRSVYPTPTDEDYVRGYMTRYFVKHKLNNPVRIFETDQEEYVNISSADDLPYILYDCVPVSWMISDMGGQVDVAATNQKTIHGLESQFKGISKYFTNLKEFSKL